MNADAPADGIGWRPFGVFQGRTDGWDVSLHACEVKGEESRAIEALFPFRQLGSQSQTFFIKRRLLQY